MARSWIVSAAYFAVGSGIGRRRRLWSGLWLAPLLLAACGSDGSSAARSTALDTSNRSVDMAEPLTCDPVAEAPVFDASQMTLAAAFGEHFKMGVAVSGRVSSGMDPSAAELAASQYNRATPENAFKWQSIQNVEGMFNFGPAEAFLDFAERSGMEVHGHTIVWHQQVPGWVFLAPGGGPAPSELVLARLETHMAALSERIGSRVHYWDVVNEAFNDDGSLRVTPWRTSLGDDYLAQVFMLADRYFPDGKLVYNDFGMENAGKREGVARMVRDLKSRGIRIDAVGSQGHFRLDTPTVSAIEQSILSFSEAGAEVLITEMDVDVLPAAQQNQVADLSMNAELSAQLNPYAECLPTVIGALAADRWGSIFELFVQHSDKISSVTLWGVSDRYSWLNNWPVNGRTNYGLLFDRNLQPKAAWQSVIEASGVSP